MRPGDHVVDIFPALHKYRAGVPFFRSMNHCSPVAEKWLTGLATQKRSQ
jgi:hypothetical protein